MFRTDLLRRLIALAAAYGLALQMLLAATIMLAPGGAWASVICAPDHHSKAGGSGDAPAPPTPGHACPFCPLVGASAAALPAGAASPARIYGAGAAMSPWRGAEVPTPALARAGLARAPPA